MSTLDRLEAIIAELEDELRRAIIDRLCTVGRVLPGEKLILIKSICEYKNKELIKDSA